eukprot:TRINITY_DN2805_c0_g1_i2.p1 TRINITY_DN2805_c0_g1~~TRINITY_DN2805_c0_g1_i2.p1  ORF type:complete len:204 (+),score=33.88 TRINITY_DN2805_c0_g1_i2:45-656(+)
MSKRVIIDTDPGIDDTAALLWVFANPSIDIIAFTTVFGNGTIEQTTKNLLVLMETCKKTQIPVYKGADKPILRNASFGHFVHGNNAFGDIDFPESLNLKIENIHAANAIVSLILRHPNELTLIALGPVTNVALALILEPKIASLVKEIVVMGGCVNTAGNVSPVATANFFNDPEAAKILYESGAPIVQVGRVFFFFSILNFIQ